MGFTDKQKELLAEQHHRWVLTCGATRSGKSYLQYYLIPKKIRELKDKDGLIVLMGNTKGTLQRNIIEPLKAIWGDELVGNINNENKIKLFGCWCYALGADKINQVDRLRGSSIKLCFGDEVVTWHEEVFQMLKSRLDKSYSAFFGTANPASPKHWLKKNFIDTAEKKGIDLFYQHYSIFDNPYCEIIDVLCKEYEGTVYYDRYILGLWSHAEGLCFVNFANDPDANDIEHEDLPNKYYWLKIGFDIGGNKSAYALTATGLGYDNVLYVIKSEKIQAEDIQTEKLMNHIRKFTESVNELIKKTNQTFEYMFCDHVDIVINTINDERIIYADKAYKPPIKDRPILYTRLLYKKKLRFLKGQCDSLKEEIKEMIWDDKSDDPIPLDDGTLQIDGYDSMTYSISDDWHYLSSLAKDEGE